MCKAKWITCAACGNEGRVGNAKPVEDDIAALYTLDAGHGAKDLMTFQRVLILTGSY